jgi:hypothetical protein
MALYLFESTRYRMKYLEKYAFVFIPNIMNSKELVSKILFELKDQQSLSTAIMKKLNEIVMDYFNLDDVEKKSVLTLHKKMYKSFAVN